MINEARYIQSYAKIIGVKEEAAISYAQKKGTLALINNASGLLTTKTQREKHKAFVDLYRMSSELHHENPVLSSPEAVTSFMQSVMEHIHYKEAMMAVFLDTKNRVIDYEEVSLGTINSSIVHQEKYFEVLSSIRQMRLSSATITPPEILHQAARTERLPSD